LFDDYLTVVKRLLKNFLKTFKQSLDDFSTIVTRLLNDCRTIVE